MTVKEFKMLFPEEKMFFYDIFGADISDKPPFILDLLTVIGSGHRPDGTIEVEVDYIN